MYDIRYMVPTANGNFREKQISISGYQEMKDTVERIKSVGYEVLVNSMCKSCYRYLTDCPGELNHVYTGCVNKRSRIAC